MIKGWATNAICGCMRTFSRRVCIHSFFDLRERLPCRFPVQGSFVQNATFPYVTQISSKVTIEHLPREVEGFDQTEEMCQHHHALSAHFRFPFSEHITESLQYCLLVSFPIVRWCHERGLTSTLLRFGYLCLRTCTMFAQLIPPALLRHCFREE